MSSRSRPVRSTWLSLRSAWVKTSLATVTQSNRFAAGMFLVQLMSGENEDADGAAGLAPGNSSVVMGYLNYRLSGPRLADGGPRASCMIDPEGEFDQIQRGERNES